ncbi:MAG: efflux RND transporter periplasmic adaptor subunit [Lachnospiraceae bacterium]
MFGKNKKETSVNVTGGKTKGKKRKGWKIAAVLLVLVILFLVVRNALFSNASQSVVFVDTVEAVNDTIKSELNLSGVIESEKTTVYASPVSALVESVDAQEGQLVSAGDYLITYSTDSLEQNYSIAELQAKASDATASESLKESAKSSNELATANTNIAAYQAQLDTLYSELATLNNQSVQYEITANNNTALQAEIAEFTTQLQAVNVSIAALEVKAADGSITSEESAQLTSLLDKKAVLNEKIEKREKKLTDSTDLANAVTNLASQIRDKTNQIAEAESNMAEAKASQSTAEATILSEDQKANISYNQEASQLTLEQSADVLSKAKAGIIAESDGIVTSVQAVNGTMSTEGASLLTIADNSEMCVVLAVSKYNLESIHEDQSVSVTFMEHEYQGKVSYISRLAETGTSGSALVTVKVHLDDPDENLVIGLEADADIMIGTAEDVLVIPLQAVNTDNKGDFVYTVENNIVQRKYVETGLASVENIEIKSGLVAGEKVITTVSSEIIEGITVVENSQMIQTESESNTTGTEAAE